MSERGIAMKGQLVRFEDLPSKGRNYPEDIEIYINPLTVKDQIDMDRLGISQAEYFQRALDGITISGNFDKGNLYFYDVQFMDLVRRLYTFDIEEEIMIKDYPCSNYNCDGKVDCKFKMYQVEFTDYAEDIFGKSFTFSDGTEVIVEPITVANFIKLCRKYMTNKKDKSDSDALLAYYTYCIKDVVGREFKSIDKRNEFLIDYLGSLTKNKDAKILKKIEVETSSDIVPFKEICPECGEIVEVRLYPSANFQQDDTDV